jgi:hypothetical protein
LVRLVLLGWPHLDRSWKNDIAHAARMLGWSVANLQPDAVSTRDVIQACRSADLLIWARTHRRDPFGDVEAMLRRVEAGGTRTVGVHLDLYWGVPNRERQIGVHPWWSCQTVWTADGGVRDWTGRGVNHRWLVPPAPDRFAGRGVPRPEMTADVIFVGGLAPVHKGRKGLLDWARNRYGDRFAWWGKAGRGAIWGRDLTDLYASAKVVLGDSVPAPYYWSDRVPGTLGRGGVLVHPHVEGLVEQYGDAIVTYPRGDYDTLGDIVDGLLADPERREALREAAVSTVQDRHLWAHRLPDIAGTETTS